MSIRFIGKDVYVPSQPGNFARGKTKVIRMSTLPDQQEIKKNRAISYKQQLDRQVEEARKRKKETKLKQQEEDLKRQRDFYKSLNQVQILNPEQQHAKTRIYEEPTHDDSNYHYEPSRLAHMGKRRIDIPIFQNKVDLVNDSKFNANSAYHYQMSEYSGINLQRRRKQFNEEIDRNLKDAFDAVSRSKNVFDLNQEVQHVRRRIKTEQQSPPLQFHRSLQNDNFESLPYQGRGSHKHTNTQFYSRVMY